MEEIPFSSWAVGVIETRGVRWRLGEAGRISQKGQSSRDTLF